MNLFEIDQQIRDLMNQTDDDGCVTQEAMEQLLGLEQTTEIKLEALACLIKERRADAKALKAEADTLTKRAKVNENDADRMESYLVNFMTSTNRDKFSTSRCAISFRESTGVVIDNEAFVKIYGKYWVTPEPTLSKKLLGDDLKQGIEIPGARLEIRRNVQVK